MTISNEQNEKYLASVCQIRENIGYRTGFGNGVFITPSHVLTAWHVLKGAKTNTITFENINGAMAKIKPGGYKIRKDSADLAIVELDKPIGEGLYIRPINKHLINNQQSTIVN